jgi:hypothetical protein
MAKKGRNLMGGRNPKRKKAIDEAVGEAMSNGGMRSSPRPRARPSKPPMKRPMATSLRPRARPDDMPTVDEIGAIERGNRAAMREAYDQQTLAGGMKYGGKVKKMRNGGKVRGAGMAKKGVRACKMR